MFSYELNQFMHIPDSGIRVQELGSDEVKTIYPPATRKPNTTCVRNGFRAVVDKNGDYFVGPYNLSLPFPATGKDMPVLLSDVPMLVLDQFFWNPA